MAKEYNTVEKILKNEKIMSYIPPPLPLSKEEIVRRIKAGAKTLEEIDPELWKWKKQRDFSHMIQAIILLVATTILMITFLIVMFK